MDFMDLDTMDRQELTDALERVRALIEALDEEEPRDMNSEAYEEWGERHEELEDLADEIMDLLEDMV
jgi:chromosome segregation ATPase